jgi:lipopolysaccharide transport system ATP-binding protein
MSKDVLIKVEHVSKKYCRSLERSMLYGVQDVACDMLGLDGHNRQLRKNEFWAIDDVSFEIRRGECLGIIGPNGAGKSTLLKMLNGIILPDKGKITIRGRVGALIELGAGFHPMLTGRENIYVNGAILGLRRKEIDRKLDEIVAFADLEDFIDSPVKFYSSGMYIRLGFAVAAYLNPDVLLIDEVLAVGDVAFRLKCFNHVRSLVESGSAIILVTHSQNDIARVCGRGIVLTQGRQLASDSLAQAIRQYQELLQTLSKAAREQRDTPVRLKAVRTLDSQRMAARHFRSGEHVLVDIHYESRISANDCVFVIKLASHELGEFVSFTNRVAGQKIPISMGSGNIIVRLRNVPLLGGNYIVQVHMYNAETKIFWDQAVPACTFDIIEPNPEIWKEFHTLRLEHDWLINPKCSLESFT